MKRLNESLAAAWLAAAKRLGGVIGK